MAMLTDEFTIQSISPSMEQDQNAHIRSLTGNMALAEKGGNSFILSLYCNGKNSRMNSKQAD